MTDWSVSGTYLESCNCEAICPCRMVGGVPGGRSTYGECFGILCWRIEDGTYGNTRLEGLAAAMAVRYHDDEPGSPWRIVLYVDERGDDRARGALADIFLGRSGGEGILRLPWVRKPSELVDIRPRRIEIEHEGGGHRLRVGAGVSLSASRPVRTDETVTCVIPGHDQPGVELYADELFVADDPFAWELSGNCAFTSRFAYSS